jgi:ribosomal protein S27AE
MQKECLILGLWQRFLNKYTMKRPICPACTQRPCAINYHKDGIAHYRAKCGYCISRNRKIKPAVPRWQASGYKKKPTCDRCGFRAKHASQLLVYHVDGNLHNSELRNLKTICLNCTEEIKRADFPWRPGDLEPDR